MATPLPVEAVDLPDFTDTLQQSTKRKVGNGSFGTVYSCLCTQRGEVSMSVPILGSTHTPFCLQVAVKAITFPRSFDQAKKDTFLRVSWQQLPAAQFVDLWPDPRK